MDRITKRTLVDEQNRPVAVQIPYEDWLRIAAELGIDSAEASDESADVTDLFGVISLPDDALAYQQRTRAEWA
jgi:hypothetical protein